MIARFQPDVLALPVLTTYDKAVDCWVFHGPRESRSGGSGVGGMIRRRVSTDEVHAIADKQRTKSDTK